MSDQFKFRPKENDSTNLSPQKKETKSSANRSWLKPYKPYDAQDSLLKRRKENILRNSSAEDDVQGLLQLNKVRKVLGLSNKENDLSKSEFKPNDQGEENGDIALDGMTAKPKGNKRISFASDSQQRQYMDTGENKENRDPRSRDIGPNGQGDDAQKTKMAKYLRKQLGISQEEIDKFRELGSKLSKIDPGQSEAIKRIIEESGLKPEQLEKFNKLLDASESNGQGDQTNGEGPKVKGTRSPQKNEVNGEERSSEMPKVTQADIDKEIQKIERIRKWHDFIELMMAMPTRGNGY